MVHVYPTAQLSGASPSSSPTAAAKALSAQSGEESFGSGGWARACGVAGARSGQRMRVGAAMRGVGGAGGPMAWAEGEQLGTYCLLQAASFN